DWQSIASSADGSRLIAVARSGEELTSTDTGVTWTPRSTGSFRWEAVASSGYGYKLVAVGHYSQIYTSSDSGATWRPSGSERFWSSVASSLDGDKLVAVADQIYT